MVRDAAGRGAWLRRRARSRSQVIRTTGDRIQDRPLAEAGGKGLFTKEIEEALLAGAIDLAVHSAKDMPTVLPRRAWCLSACLRARGPARRVHQPQGASRIAELPRGAAVGTASLRRQALVKRLRPDLRVVPLRGNVETRLRKLDEGEADATLLALAGLEAARPRRCRDRDARRRRIPAGGRAGRHRHRDARRRRADARPAGARSIMPTPSIALACRARVPRRARRLLPHADRRSCDDRRRHACASAA